MTKILERLEPLLRRVADGYSEAWDGSNTVGRLDEDAASASNEIEENVAGMAEWAQNDLLQIWDAYAYFAGVGDASLIAKDISGLAGAPALTAESTDEDLEVLEGIIESVCMDGQLDSCDVLTDVGGMLERVRSFLIEDMP